MLVFFPGLILAFSAVSGQVSADVDDRFAEAVAAGAEVVRPLANQFYGDRSGTVTPRCSRGTKTRSPDQPWDSVQAAQNSGVRHSGRSG